MAEEKKNQTQEVANFADAIVNSFIAFKNNIVLGKDSSKKNIFEKYQNECKNDKLSIVKITKLLEEQAGKTIEEKDVNAVKLAIEDLVKLASNINLALISGYRFVSDDNLVRSIAKKFKKNEDEVSVEIFVSVGPLFVGTDRWRALPHGRVSNENERNILDECNSKITSIVDKFNELVPSNKIAYEVIDNQVMKFDEYIAKCKNGLVLYTRTALTNINKAYKKYVFWIGAKYVGITVGIVVIGGVSYYIYENGWEAVIDKIKSIIPAKKEESTTDANNDLFELEEIPVDENNNSNIDAIY